MYDFEENTSFTQDLQQGRTVREVLRKHKGDVLAFIDQTSYGNNLYSTSSTVMNSIIGDYFESFYERQKISAEDENTSMFGSTVTTGFWIGYWHKQDQSKPDI